MPPLKVANVVRKPSGAPETKEAAKDQSKRLTPRTPAEEKFPYEEAFSRTLGVVTPAELQTLRRSRVAIAGLGGVGGFHVTTLARLGISNFSISDFDKFDYVNFNRQAGAFCSTVGLAKTDVIAKMTRDINPEADVRCFPAGVQESNIDAFLEGVDVYVDGLDFFAFKAREKIFARCREKGIPAVTAAPLGMGTAVMVFTPDGMSFEDYFGFEGRTDAEKAVRFLIGLSPKQMHTESVVDPARIDMRNFRGPSAPMGCMLAAGCAATETLKVILKRGPLYAAPWGYHFDAYTTRMQRFRVPEGHRNQEVSLLISGMLKQFAAMTAGARPPAGK